ncbi:MAG: hypothetical protein A4S09_08385 [Proteobacteria bacterium SG_bin7]|nr:MAG: hypothetical protein A4S09_08385 [Proteobacteria bacterium SG_bin7]
MSHDLIKNSKKNYFTKLQNPKSFATYPIYSRVHGIDLEINFSNPATRGWIMEMLSTYNCPIWESKEFKKILGPNHLVTNWIDVTEMLKVTPEEWCDDANDDLEIIFTDEKEWAFQRDFVGAISGNMINIFCPSNFNDSFFNAVRWFLPRHLVDFNSLVMHSSAFVDKNGNAHLFVGPSGVGKTTTVTRIMGHEILGDDMILISIDGKNVTAQTPVLGQNPRFAGCAGKQFPLKGIHFLQQGSKVQKKNISSLESMRRLSASVLYPNWQFENPERLKKISALIKNFVANTSCDELTLDISMPFLGVIDESYN